MKKTYIPVDKASRITFTTSKGDKYILEYTIDSIREMDRRGFVAADILNKPTLMLPSLFSGAFIANHRKAKQGFIDDMYAQMDDKAELLDRLCGMYSNALDAFIDELTATDNPQKWESE